MHICQPFDFFFFLVNVCFEQLCEDDSKLFYVMLGIL